MRGRFGEDVPDVADVGHEGHHELFADRVDRRVRDLREQLLEVVEEEARLPGKNRERGVVAHCPDGFVPRLGHRLQDEVEVFERVAEEGLLVDEILGDARGDDLGEEPLDGDAVLLDPAAVGAAARVEGLEFGVFEKAVLREIEPEHGARLETALAGDVRGGDVEDAGLGGEDEEALLGERPARGAEAVAVERRAHARAVRERDGGGTVPRLHERGVVLVEGAHVMAHVVLRAPGLGEEHEHRVGGVAPGGDEQLEHVVERGGVGLAGLHEREELLEVVAEEGRGERRLARGKRVEVTLERVDFAVVGKGAEGVGERPARKGVRGVALVDDREGGDEVGIGEVLVETLDLRGEEEALVDDRLRGAGAEVDIVRPLLDLAADDVKAALEFDGGEAVGAADEEFADLRKDAAGIVADCIRIDGDITPGENPSALGVDDGFKDVLLTDAAEDHRDTVLSSRGKPGDDLAEERVGDAQKKPGTVARARVVTRRAAVHKAFEHGEAGFDDGVRREVVKARDESDSAGVVFIFRAVQPPLSIFCLVHGHVPSRCCVADSMPIDAASLIYYKEGGAEREECNSL